MRWRIKNAKYYAEQPKITLSSMRKWFEEHYLAQKRILFWVVGDRGRKIGHMGLYQFTDETVEIDNVARGVDGEPGIMTEGLKELILIARRLTKRIYLKVLMTNDHAIEFYKKNGFMEIDRVLYKGKLFIKMEYANCR